jgi:hypothetical protein
MADRQNDFADTRPAHGNASFGPGPKRTRVESNAASWLKDAAAMFLGAAVVYFLQFLIQR